MRTNTLTHTHHSPSRAVGHLPGQKGHRSVRRQIVPPALNIPDSAAASVFRAVRLRGPVGRDVIAGVTSLSIATVNRQVIALLEAGLLRERADLAVSGAIGRPRSGAQGNTNVTNGCINLSTGDAQQYYQSAIYGDPVEVTGSSIQLSYSDGDLWDWAVDWDTWVAMSALPPPSAHPPASQIPVTAPVTPSNAPTLSGTPTTSTTPASTGPATPGG